MISYRLSDEQEQLRATVAEFAREVVAPVIGGYYERAEFPYGLVERMGGLGLFGLGLGFGHARNPTERPSRPRLPPRPPRRSRRPWRR